MSKKIPLASAAEELSWALQSSEWPEASEVRTKTQERKEAVLSLARREVEKCLVEQRETADKEPGVQKFRQLNPHTQMAHMEEMPARLFYYLERAFSLPEDYREFTGKTSRNEEKKLINTLIFHPEFFSDDLLIGLEICEKEDLYRKRIEAKLERRIAAIPLLKGAFSHIEHLPFGTRGHTARVISFNDPGKPWDGKYILFQERSGLEITAEWTKRKALTIVPHVFEDIFSLARSQEKAIKAMSQRGAKVELLKEHIDNLLLRWHSLADEARRIEIMKLREELQGKQTFHEISALKWRIEKIDFSHAQISTGRLIGAWNDLMQSHTEKMGKTGAISEQVGMLRSIIRMEANRFETMYQEFLSIVSSLSHADIDQSLQEQQKWITGEITLSPEVRGQVRTFLPMLREYVEFYGRQPFVGLPFSAIHDFVGYVYDVLKNDSVDDRKIVQTIFAATLYLKLHRVQVESYNIKDQLKSAQEAWKNLFPIDKKNSIIVSIETMLIDLQTIHILKNISMSKPIQEKFMGHIRALENIKWCLGSGDIKGAYGHIDELLYSW